MSNLKTFFILKMLSKSLDVNCKNNSSEVNDLFPEHGMPEGQSQRLMPISIVRTWQVEYQEKLSEWGEYR